MLTLVFLVYFTIFICVFLIKKIQPTLVFSIIFLTSGFIYVSSIILLVHFFYYFLILKKPNTKLVLLSLFLIVVTCFINFFGNNNEPVYLELFQLLVFIFLVVILKQKNIFPKYFLKSICYGLLTGSIILSLNIIITYFNFNYIDQEEFSYFSISGTFNYSAFYMFFGLIVSPYILFKKKIYRILLFLLFAVAVFFLQTRSSFIFGIIFFIFLTVKIKNLRNFISSSIIFFLLLSLFLNSNYVDENNQNDIVYSVSNFENNTSNLERLQMITNSFEGINTNPFGAGLGNAKILLNKVYIYHPHAHNVLANWIYELGYYGIILYVLFVYSIIKYLKFSNNKTHKTINVCIFFILFSSVISSLQYNILMTLTTYLGLVIIHELSHSINYD